MRKHRPARLFAFVVLAAVTAVSSAVATGGATPFAVTSTLDGKTVLPLRIHWIAHPRGPANEIRSVQFLIDGRLAWTGRHAAYYYGGNEGADGNSLVTTFLTAGVHTFTVRALSVTGQAATDTVKARVVEAPAPPPRLAGNWTRIVTPADLRKGPRGPPAGRWTLHITPVGWGWSANDRFDARYFPNGDVAFGPEINTPGQPNGAFCGIDPLHVWAVTLSTDDRTMRLAPRGHDGCGDRVAIMEGTWTRVG